MDTVIYRSTGATSGGYRGPAAILNWTARVRLYSTRPRRNRKICGAVLVKTAAPFLRRQEGNHGRRPQRVPAEVRKGPRSGGSREGGHRDGGEERVRTGPHAAADRRRRAFLYARLGDNVQQHGGLGRSARGGDELRRVAALVREVLGARRVRVPRGVPGRGCADL